MGASPKDQAAFGTWCVAQRVLSYDYLWNEVRVKGGAYGTGFRRTLQGLVQFWSYRDPGIDATLARYQATADWLASWTPTKEEMVGYVVSTVATHDTPQKPRALARRQDSMLLSCRPEGWREQVRKDELSATAQDIQALAQPLSYIKQGNTVVVFGPREAIEASTVEFEQVVELIG